MDKQGIVSFTDRQRLYSDIYRQGLWIARIDKNYIVLQREKKFLGLRTDKNCVMLGKT